jgi:hypothetical protein
MELRVPVCAMVEDMTEREGLVGRAAMGRCRRQRQRQRQQGQLGGSSDSDERQQQRRSYARDGIAGTSSAHVGGLGFAEERSEAEGAR